MKSHTSNVTVRQWLGIFGAPMIPLAILSAILHGGNAISLWPDSRPVIDIDRTILIHQIEASRQEDPVDVLLLGDSSCLMDVDAGQLQRDSGMSCLNLATVSYLDLDHHRQLGESYIRANPGHPKMILLLMHPESLRRSGADAFTARFFTNYLKRKPIPTRRNFLSRMDRVLGVDLFRHAILARAVPSPLPGAFGTQYGFTSNLEDYMTDHRGSLADPTTRDLVGNPEYGLNPALKSKSIRMRNSLPMEVKIIIGMTPVPEGFPFSDFPEISRSMLTHWADWLEADGVLRDLPSTLPASLFASTTHLTEEGARQFTAKLAELLRDHAF